MTATSPCARRLVALAASLACAAVAATPAAAANRHLDIVGGTTVPAGAWASVAYLQGGYHDPNGRAHVFACTGSVIAPQWIVTAAHCAIGNPGQPPEQMTATLGVIDYTDPARHDIAVDRFVPDPSYDPTRQLNDIALVHLAQPTSQPATALAASGQTYSSPANVPNAAGWGALDQSGTKLGTTLQQAYLQVRAPAECSTLVSGFDPSTQTCAGTQGATGPCFGDSGGPLVEFDSNGAPVLWGVTSYGPQVSAGLAPCSVDLPAVYTWVPAFAGFIQATMASSPAAAPAPQPVGATSPPAAACVKARTRLTAARAAERTALRRLLAARTHLRGTAAQRRVTTLSRRYHAARTRRLRLAVGARRCA
jgi:secreted trypsin-like serine protease